MAYQGIAKVQHYVPQFLLRNFCAGESDQIKVFNKKNAKTFVTNAKNVASESRFYDLKNPSFPFSVEPVLTKIESAAKPVLARLVSENTVAALTDDDRRTLSEFFAVQLVRTRASRAAFDDFAEQKVQQFRAQFGLTAEETAGCGMELDEGQRSVLGIRTILEAPNAFARSFFSKAWLLIEPPKGKEFVIGDHPMALRNIVTNSELFDDTGLNQPGTEVNFPITPKRALQLWCPEFSEHMLKQAVQFRALRVQSHRARIVFQVEQSMKTGALFPCSEQQLYTFNRLQVVQAETYIFSSCGDFRLAKELVANDESLRRGRRVQVKS